MGMSMHERSSRVPSEKNKLLASHERSSRASSEKHKLIWLGGVAHVYHEPRSRALQATC